MAHQRTPRTPPRAGSVLAFSLKGEGWSETREKRREVAMPGKSVSPTLEKPSEITELIYEIMQERGGFPHNDKEEAPPENDLIRMAEAP